MKKKQTLDGAHVKCGTHFALQAGLICTVSFPVTHLEFI